ncbi:MAG: PKD domain-containing protein, partial [Marinoscillum sp.]
MERWEYSLTGEQPWTTISQTDTTLNFTNLDVSTWYRVVVKSGVCETKISNKIKIKVDEPTISGAISGTQEVCTALNTGTLFLNDYTGDVSKWQKSENLTEWVSISNITNRQTFTNLETTTYYRVIVKSGVCSIDTTRAFEVKVNPLPEVSFTSSEVCEGSSTTLNNSTTVEDGFLSAFLWDFNDGESSTLDSPLHTYATYGTFGVKLIVTSSEGCIDSLTQNVIVNPKPISDFSQENVCVGFAMDFSDLSIVDLGSLDEYSWNFGDGNNSTDSDVSHTYGTDGIFEVSLEVTTDKG